LQWTGRSGGAEFEEAAGKNGTAGGSKLKKNNFPEEWSLMRR
jgi:hypothetical protein